jgi:hypothetical protein
MPGDSLRTEMPTLEPVGMTYMTALTNSALLKKLSNDEGGFYSATKRPMPIHDCASSCRFFL